MTMTLRYLMPLLLFLAMGQASAGGMLRLATSTTTASSGLLTMLLPAFEAATGYTTEFRGVGSGTALRLGREGQVDALLVHAPEAETRFIVDGHGVARIPVMHNDFVIVGPPDDPAGVSGMTDVAAAMLRIRGRGALFLSRGDDSGTHQKELALWQAAGMDPYAMPWYRELGMGISELLRTASKQQAYTLADRGTWLAMRNELQLRLLVEGDPLLYNPYHVIAVNPQRHPQVNGTAAQRFIDWLCSATAQQLIADFRKHGQALFIPDCLPDADTPSSSASAATADLRP